MIFLFMNAISSNPLCGPQLFGIMCDIFIVLGIIAYFVEERD